MTLSNSLYLRAEIVVSSPFVLLSVCDKCDKLYRAGRSWPTAMRPLRKVFDDCFPIH